MSIIAGVTVNWQLSPRVITIPSSITEINIEDLQDTLLDLEDDVEGILWTDLRATSGGEDLGGGVFVGWTMELQNAVIAPAPRQISNSSGAITTADADGLTLIDSGATFISDGVIAGASIVNITDGSVTSVIEVVSETQLMHYALDDGTDDDWDISDSYKVWNEIQFNISGGNLVGVDGVGDPISPIRSTFGNEILKTSSSSATFTEQSAIQFASFGGGVTVDVINGTAGSAFPIGTAEFPVDNFVDAKIIADSRGFHIFFIESDVTLSTEDFSAGHEFRGRSESSTTITVDSGADVSNCEFNNATILGILDGDNKLRECIVSDLNFFSGEIEDCIFNAGTVTFSGPVSNILRSFSGVAGTATPIIDLGGSGQTVSIRDYNGGMKVINKTGTESMSIDLNSGQVILDATVTDGVIVVRGIGKLTDNSVGATINSADLLNRESITEPNWDTIWVDAGAGVAGTAFPIGTASNPVDNFADAKIISDRIGIKRIFVHGSFTLTEDFSRYELITHTPSHCTIDLNDQIATNTFFLNITITGQQNSGAASVYDGCVISDGVTNMQGTFNDCTLLGDFTVVVGALKQVVFNNCSAGGTTGLNIYSQSGSIIVGTKLCGTWTLHDAVAGPPPTIAQLEFNSGQITLDPSCVGGLVILAGVVNVVDTSGVACIVTRDAQMQTSSLVDAVWDEQEEDHEVEGSIGDHLRRIRNQKV